jgi:hypothetical protein
LKSDSKALSPSFFSISDASEAKISPCAFPTSMDSSLIQSEVWNSHKFRCSI